MSVDANQLIVTVSSSVVGVSAAVALIGGVITRSFRHHAEEVVKAVVSDVKVDMIARLDQSDASTREQLGEVKADVAAVKATAEQTKLDLATQFGGNGGGMRQALNEHGVSIARIEGKLGIGSGVPS